MCNPGSEEVPGWPALQDALLPLAHPGIEGAREFRRTPCRAATHATTRSLPDARVAASAERVRWRSTCRSDGRYKKHLRARESSSQIPSEREPLSLWLRERRAESPLTPT